MSKVFGDHPFLHICECCGKTEILTSKEAFDLGWDYPGEGGLFPETAFGIVGPRTCGTCPMTGTLWWEIVCNKKQIHELSDKHKETLLRILQEPSIYDIKQEKE